MVQFGVQQRFLPTEYMAVVYGLAWCIAKVLVCWLHGRSLWSSLLYNKGSCPTDYMTEVNGTAWCTTKVLALLIAW